MIGSLVSVLSPLADPVAEALVHFLWQGGLIALLLSGVLQLLRNHSADLRYRWACWVVWSAFWR